METRNYTAEFNVGDSIVVNSPDYEFFHGKPHPLAGKNGVVKKVIFGVGQRHRRGQVSCGT